MPSSYPWKQTRGLPTSGTWPLAAMEISFRRPPEKAPLNFPEQSTWMRSGSGCYRASFLHTAISGKANSAASLPMQIWKAGLTPCTASKLPHEAQQTFMHSPDAGACNMQKTGSSLHLTSPLPEKTRAAWLIVASYVVLLIPESESCMVSTSAPSIHNGAWNKQEIGWRSFCNGPNSSPNLNDTSVR